MPHINLHRQTLSFYNNSNNIYCMDTSSQMNLKSSHEEYPKLRLYLMEFMYHGGTLFYVIFCLFVNYKFLGDAKIPYFSDSFLRGVGIAFVLVALLIGIMSMWQVKIAARKKALVTNGFYSLTRNPAEGALIFFGMPGIALLTCRLLMLTAIFFQAWLFLKLIPEEEAQLEHDFGEEYREYKAKVPRLVPTVPDIQLLMH
eukprot:TRINITY_DN1732_c0_g1_i2.p2 TRINITY_DN1732_c0_g1~~TRINITY_DN1732_c0_g1_i2.p2  ORF type:complete len:214 (+),score=8.41 TRINITY_DN1732_c0_g1_i2:45-644(+)